MRISIRPLCPLYNPPSVGSEDTTNSGRILSSLMMYCQQRPSQSSSCTVPTTITRYLSFRSPMSFMILAAYTAETVPPSWSETPLPPILVSSSYPSYGSNVQFDLFPIPTVSMCPSKQIRVFPDPMNPITLPCGSTLTSSKPTFSISFLMVSTCFASSADSPGFFTIALKKALMSAL